MPHLRVPEDGVNIDGAEWPGGAVIDVTDPYWARQLLAAGAKDVEDEVTAAAAAAVHGEAPQSQQPALDSVAGEGGESEGGRRGRR